jgi:phenylacetate-CoA ligase
VGKIVARVLDAAAGALFVPYWDFWNREIGGVRSDELKRLQVSQWRDISRDQQVKALEIAWYAHNHSPFYRQRGSAPSSMEEFSKMPILTKDDLRAHGDEIFSGEYKREELVHSKTGGSTGVALNVSCDRICQQRRNAAALHSDLWSGWKLGETRGALWGNPPVPQGLKGKARAHLFDRLIFLDTIEMSATNMNHFIQRLLAGNVRTLYGHAHSLFVFANHVAASGATGLQIRSIISTSMILLPGERQRIEQVFGCRVSDRYGCEEVSLIASECERHEGLHVNTDHVYLEILRPDGTPAAPGEEGAVVVTELINHGQPLLRYAVGDVASLSPRNCSCGRPRPVLERVIGRTADFLVRRDGSLVAGVSLVERTLTAIAGLAQMQIVQDRPEELLINIVADEKFSSDTESRLKAEMRRAFGDVSVTIHKGDKLEQEKNGKFRFAICRVATRYQEAAR